MATRNTNRDSSNAESDITNGTGALADLARQQMATGATTACAMLRALETFHQPQQHMIQRAALLQEQTADRLRSAVSPIELVAIHSTVMMSGLSEMAQYAQEMMLASIKAQSEFLKPAQQQQQSASQGVGAAGPLFQAWQSVFTAPMQGMGGAGAPRHH